MLPLILMLATAVIVPGEVPVVADVHPDETSYIQELKEWHRQGDELLVVVLATQAAIPFPANTYYPPETVDLILQTYFPDPVGLDWARRVSYCESSWRLDALGALGEVGWFQHRPEFWANRSMWAGYPDGDIWNPEINTAVASFMYYSPDFGPSHWSCK